MTTQTFGVYGGRYVPETLIPALDELTAGWEVAKNDSSFHAELRDLLLGEAAHHQVRVGCTSVRLTSTRSR